MTDHDDSADDDFEGSDLDAVIAAALDHDEGRQPPAADIARLRARVAAAAESTRVPVTPIRRASRRDLLVGGVAASLGAAAGAAAALIGRDDAPSGPPMEAIAFSGATVPATASLINHTWGTELVLDIADLPADRVYRVDYLDQAGTNHDAGSFRSVAGVTMKCRFNSEILRADATAIVISDDDGAVVLRAELSA